VRGAFFRRVPRSDILDRVRVAELVGLRQLRIAEGQPGDPQPGEVQVRVQAVGICGSDLHAYTEGAVGDTPCAYPMVLGHEPAGVVVRAGPGVTGWAPGDRVALEPALCCYHCEFCLMGRHNLCARLRFLSSPPDPGFFRDLVNLPAQNLLALPSALSVAEGALVEPLAVVLHSLKFAAPAVSDTVAVFGAGPIGLLTIAVLRRAGVRRLWAVEPLAHRRELARRLGADAAIDPAEVDPIEAVRGDSGGRGVDVAIDCAAKGDTANQCISVARRGGRVVFTGIPSELRIPLDFHRWRRKELALHQVRRSNHEGAIARDLLARDRGLFAPLITHERPLEQVGDAFALVERYEDGVGKLIVRL
jgi:L-iditol 2-dehydrogenase